jgi:hypothetical protein
MTDLSAFEPLYRALASTVAQLRLRSGATIRGVAPIPLTGGEASAARRALTELVPYERNMSKMFDGMRSGQLNRYRGAGHQFVVHALMEYVFAGSLADAKSPVWDLPVTDGLVNLVVTDESAPSDAVNHLKSVYSKDRLDVLLQAEGTTVRQLADDLRVKQQAAHRARIAMRQAALERAKLVLSEQDLTLLLDKTLY